MPRRAPRGHTDIWARPHRRARRSTDCRGACAARRARPQLRLPREARGRQRRRRRYAAKRAADAGHHARRGRGRQRPRDGEDPFGVGRESQNHYRPGRTPARLWHSGPDHTRPNTGTDVHRHGRLEPHRRGEAQSPPAHPHHRQRRHRLGAGRPARLRHLRRGCRDGGTRHLRTPMDIQGDTRHPGRRRPPHRPRHRQPVRPDDGTVDAGRPQGAGARQRGAYRRIPRHPARQAPSGGQSAV